VRLFAIKYFANYPALCLTIVNKEENTMFPNTADELLEALTMQQANLPTYQDAVDATAEEIKDNNQDRANLAMALSNTALADTAKQVVFQIKNAVYNGNQNEPISPNPTFAILALPFPEMKAGSFTRFRNRKARFKSAKGYTSEIGIALGLEKPPARAISPDELIGAAMVKDLGNYRFEAEYKKQGQSGMAFQYRLKGTEKWNKSTNMLSSPAVIEIDEPAVVGAAVQIEIHCRYLKGNDQIGQWSPIYALTVNA
jgi:hypothetical protein